MLDIASIDHIGIRISDRDAAVSFYQTLGFKFVAGAAFDQGHPIVLRHPGGLVINILGPANAGQGDNILMDKKEKYPGITHFAIKVRSIEETEAFLHKAQIKITSRRQFMGVSSVFIHDPDQNVIEIVGEGPDVADLILAFEARTKADAE